MRSPEKGAIPLPFPDITTMHVEELKRYFWSSGNTPEKAIELTTQEILRRVHERVEMNAQELGMSKEVYGKMFEMYGYPETAKIIHMMKEGTVKTPEEAHQLLNVKPSSTGVDEEKNVDDVNKVLQMRPLYRHSYRAGRMLEKIDRHDAYVKKRNIIRGIAKRALEKQAKQ
ncbi:MAG: hypothetical protein V1917_04480 [Candidatus Gottesmanbacteria bacterium]